jgi:hypothetical protein
MNSRIINQLNMVGACITLANSGDYKSAWHGQPPADFGTDLGKLMDHFGSIMAKGALAEAATGGGGDAKSAAESALENTTFVVARALANHFKKSGDLDRHGKVNLTRTKIVRLRDQRLVELATAIRDLANGALAEPNAADRGVTAARVATLTGALTAFKNVFSLPRGEIVNRGALLKEIETDAAGLVEDVTDMDDLVLQFDSSELGQRFMAAWKRARIIVDAGGGPAPSDAEPTPPPTPPPAA